MKLNFKVIESIWFWWAVEALAIYVVGGAALGCMVGRLAPENA